MEEKAKFKIIYSKDADDFLNNLPTKIKDKIIYNIAKAKFVIDPELFKKLDDTDIWEFRTFYNKVKYRYIIASFKEIFLSSPSTFSYSA